MPTELKFKAWHKKADRFFECVGVNGHALEIRIKNKDNSSRIIDDRKEDYILCQSTGFKDSFGTEIYEGDLLLSDEESEFPNKVIWWPSRGMWAKYFMDDKNGDVWIPLSSPERYKVIGNVFENLGIKYGR